MYNPDREKVLERWGGMSDTLREGMSSILVMDELDSIEQNFHLSEEKSDQIARLVRGVFYGLIHIENLYKEIKDNLQVDPRLALEIYHELDKKIFESFRKEVEDNYIKTKLGSIKESEVIQPQPVEPQVVLKTESPEIINLKEDAETMVQPVKLKVEAIPSVEKPKEATPAPVSLGTIQQKAEILKPEIKTEPIKIPAQPSVPPVVAEGPFMLHQKEEAQAVFQTQTAKSFGTNPLGGFFGTTMKSFGIQKSQDSVSTAKIEMPQGPKISEEPEVQKVPVVVKKYEQEPAKTVHYSGFKSALEKGTDGSIKTITEQQQAQAKKTDSKDGMINLSDLTLNK